MKITRIEILQINPGWAYYALNYTFVRVHTDAGLYGIGQAYSAGPDRAVAEVIRDFETWLVGEDPLAVERLWALMYNGTRFPPGVVVSGAISGIEHALWDIKGKALGVPVYQLLGGKCRDHVRVYEGIYDQTTEALARSCAAAIRRH